MSTFTNMKHCLWFCASFRYVWLPLASIVTGAWLHLHHHIYIRRYSCDQHFPSTVVILSPSRFEVASPRQPVIFRKMTVAIDGVIFLITPSAISTILRRYCRISWHLASQAQESPCCSFQTYVSHRSSPNATLRVPTATRLAKMYKGNSTSLPCPQRLVTRRMGVKFIYHCYSLIAIGCVRVPSNLASLKAERWTMNAWHPPLPNFPHQSSMMCDDVTHPTAEADSWENRHISIMDTKYVIMTETRPQIDIKHKSSRDLCNMTCQEKANAISSFVARRRSVSEHVTRLSHRYCKE